VCIFTDTSIFFCFVRKPRCPWLPSKVVVLIPKTQATRQRPEAAFQIERNFLFGKQLHIRGGFGNVDDSDYSKKYPPIERHT